MSGKLLLCNQITGKTIDIWLLSVSNSWENTRRYLARIWGEALEHFCFTRVIRVEQIRFPTMVFAWFICQSSRIQFSVILFNIAKTHTHISTSGLTLWSDSHTIHSHTFLHKIPLYILCRPYGDLKKPNRSLFIGVINNKYPQQNK